MEEQKSVLITKDVLQMRSVNKLHMPCQYCDYTDHQSSTCLQAEVCPTFKTKDYSLKHIFPTLKEVKNQERSNENYRGDDHQEQVYQVR